MEMNVNAYEQNKCILCDMIEWNTLVFIQITSTCDVQYMLLELNSNYSVVLYCYFHCYGLYFGVDE